MARIAFVVGALVALIAMGILWLLVRNKKLREELQARRKERDALNFALLELHCGLGDPFPGDGGSRRKRVEAALQAAAGYAARDQIPDLDEIVEWRRILEGKE